MVKLVKNQEEVYLMKLNEKTILAYNNFQVLSDGVLKLAKEIMPDKIIYINFLNDDVQVTMKVSKHDTLVKLDEGLTIPVEEAICHRINYEEKKPLVINDFDLVDFGSNVSKTIKNSNIKSYLGIPITFKNGDRFGALCCAHHDKSAFDAHDIELLEKLADLFSYYLELEQMAFKDNLTGLYNTHFLNQLEQKILMMGGLSIMIDLDHFKDINDRYGHHQGNHVLKEIGHIVNEFSDSFMEAYGIRLGGDEFFIFVNDIKTSDQAKDALTRLLTNLNITLKKDVDLSVSASVGAYLYEPNQVSSLEELLKRTDQQLYQAKKDGKNRYVLLT